MRTWVLNVSKKKEISTKNWHIFRLSTILKNRFNWKQTNLLPLFAQIQMASWESPTPISFSHTLISLLPQKWVVMNLWITLFFTIIDNATHIRIYSRIIELHQFFIYVNKSQPTDISKPIKMSWRLMNIQLDWNWDKDPHDWIKIGERQTHQMLWSLNNLAAHEKGSKVV